MILPAHQVTTLQEHDYTITYNGEDEAVIHAEGIGDHELTKVGEMYQLYSLSGGTIRRANLNAIVMLITGTYTS
ncbi:hypothetical protein EOK75_17270 (plasmid) [Pseudorhodobacter turbinis]|uniref:Uncharacterized protein n=1 Tax=Pseudorhodobacter turbinis TaxID=2500533 RepID=A0A4V1E1A6_9RHOB|nr:hypothetical protein [Pseudorhodobacter turbinis]QCO57464.1 hypothetical protein EOK75_17270 [Pseudorhodobacter turbinis]